MTISGEKFQNACEKYNSDAVRVLSPSEAESLLQRSDVLEMSPDGYWVLSFEPMGALACNAQIVTRNLCATVFASFDQASGRPMAVSFGTPINIPLGLKHRMDFYFHQDFAKRGQDLYIAHYLKQLVYVNQFWKGNVSFSGLHCQEFDNSRVKMVLHNELNFAVPAEEDTEKPCLLVDHPDNKDVVMSKKAKL